MVTNKFSTLEICGLIKKYLGQGLSQAEIAKLLGISRQRVNYWVVNIRNKDKDENLQN